VGQPNGSNSGFGLGRANGVEAGTRGACAGADAFRSVCLRLRCRGFVFTDSGSEGTVSEGTGVVTGVVSALVGAGSAAVGESGSGWAWGTVAGGGNAGGWDLSLGQATTNAIAATTAAILPRFPQRMRAANSFMPVVGAARSELAPVAIFWPAPVRFFYGC
jgi:hypothetical protein